MKLLNHKTVTNKDIFLLKLQGEDIEFDFVNNGDLPVFFWICQNLNLLTFMCQKEYMGNLARFKILRPFGFNMNLENAVHRRRSTISVYTNDILDITEILMAHDYYRESDSEYNRSIHTLHFDFPSERRNKVYKNFNYDL